MLGSKGYTQQAGRYYHETFSHLVKIVISRAVICLAASKEWHLSQIYVNNFFLQGDLYKDMYMALTKGFHRQGEYQVCKSIYGLIQASRQWNIVDK